LPPEVSGESPALLDPQPDGNQFRTWSFEIMRFWREHAGGRSLTTIRDQARDAGGRIPTTGPTHRPGAPSAGRRHDDRPQLERLERFVALCREHGAQLTVSTSPLHHASSDRYDPAELAAVVAQVRAVVPVWDFSDPDWLSSRPELWLDESHFVPEVASMMLERIFGPP
jgi:hypothetical protein